MDKLVIAATFVAVLVNLSCALDEEVGHSVQAVEGENALSMNALSMNALSMNALSMNALSMNALSMNGLLDTTEGRQLTRYMARCALPQGADLEAEVDGTLYTFPGSIGLVPEWLDEPLSDADARWISACLYAHVNALENPTSISLRGNHAALATTQYERDLFPFEEGAYFGELFVEVPLMIACTGADAESEAAALDDVGRVCALSEGDTTMCGYDWSGYCADVCAQSTQDGFRNCAGAVEVVTVYQRGF